MISKISPSTHYYIIKLNTKNLLNALKNPPKNILYELELDFKNNQLLNKTYLFEYENGNFKELIR